jgi:ADP-heptose:LPS heptosyltransferase
MDGPTEPRRIVLRNHLSLGDVITLTASLRELHEACPGRFETGVDTCFPDVWENNPFVSPVSADDPGVTVFQCDCPLIHESNTAPYHYIHAFTQHLAQGLDVHIKPRHFHGHIVLGEEERSWGSRIWELAGTDLPFWLIVSGGKHDFTNKWWSAARWQRVVDHFKGRILFVQVGEKDHCHPALKGVLDLRGETSVRQLIRLTYHSQGVTCGVTSLMHLAAAVPFPPEKPGLRPCVVVAGGREPAHWEEYPGHQYLHTIGALPCCTHGGCWKSRTVARHDGCEQDSSLCEHPVHESTPHPDDERQGSLPKCMDMISWRQVASAIGSYFVGGVRSFLSPKQAELAQKIISRQKGHPASAGGAPCINHECPTQKHDAGHPKQAEVLAS